MTAATATTIIQEISSIPDAGLPPVVGTVARKRRRQILQSNRAKTTTMEEVQVSKKPCVAAGTNGTGANAQQMGLSPPVVAPVVPKAAAIATVVKPKAKNGKAADKSKKQQLRYDPDVPMTKDEAAAWRREQRRKRNRESAAASRQKQKDRISELEDEISVWKSKFDEAMKRIKQLEEAQAPVISDSSDSEQATPSPKSIPSPISRFTDEAHEVRTTVSPCPSPPLSPVMSGTLPLDSAQGQPYPQGFLSGQGFEGEENDNLIEISRPAVKITGVPFSLPPSNLTLKDPIPDRAPSQPEPIAAHDGTSTDLLQEDMAPIDSFAPEPFLKQEASNSLALFSEEDEKELGDFMMDAFEWL